MKILFLNAYFYPEKIAFSHLERDLIEELVIAGNEIEILCPIPTRGISQEKIREYKNIKNQNFMNGKIKVTRFWAPQEGNKILMRVFRYLWCNFKHYSLGKKYKDCDLIFSVSTPPTQGLIAGKLAKKLKIPHLYLLQDIFPDSLINAKMTKEGSLLWLIGRKMENYTYKNADKIVVINNTMRKNIIAKKVEKNKIEVISNWINIKNVYEVPKEKNSLFKKYNLSIKNFNIVYAGNFGVAQGAEIIFKIAEMLGEYSDIKFIIFGGGIYFEKIKEKNQNKENILINELLPLEYVSEVYSLGNIALITCKKGTSLASMPSKTWSIMACNTPIIASFDKNSELENILNDSGAGYCVEAGNVNELYKAILSEYKKFKNNEIKSINTREYVKKHATKQKCVKEYVDLCKKIIEKKV